MNTAIEGVSGSTSGTVAPGQVLGRYELLMPIAAGGMAMVWAARLKGTRGFQKIVAVKTMLPKLSEDDQFEQMFLDEASLASRIHHPHVVEIMDLGEQSGVLFLVMEWLEGVPLNQVMRAAKAKGGMPLPIAVRIVMQACAGLNAAHELKNEDGKLVGLVHRDVSPQNILVTTDGVTKVLDFGVAKATAMGGGASSAGQIKGKVGYMAPEQIEGGELDRRVDIFAMGIVLYALTTGKHPFRRESDAATMYNICSPQPVLPPRKIIPDYPELLEKVLLRALAKKPEQRFATVNEMLRELDQAVVGSNRANTDEDVARFIQDLMGEKLAERKEALNTALSQADKNALSPMRLADLPAQASSAISAVGLTTGVTAADLSALTSVGGWTPAARRKRLILAAVALLLVAGATVGILRLTSGSSEALPPPVDVPEWTKAKPGAKPATPPKKGPPPPRISVDSIPLEEVEEPPAPAVPQHTQPAGPARPPPKSKKPASWKHDPGF